MATVAKLVMIGIVAGIGSGFFGISRATAPRRIGVAHLTRKLIDPEGLGRVLLLWRN